MAGLKSLITNGSKFIGSHLPQFLTGVGIVGIGVTAFLSGKGALEADKRLKELKEKNEEPTKLEIVKTVAPAYIPAAVAGVGSAALFIASSKISLTQLTAMAGTAAAAEKALSDNRSAVKQIFGDKSLRKVDEKINETNARTFLSNMDIVYPTGHGNDLCCEGYLSGFKFYASSEWIWKCVNDFNRMILANESPSYNEFIQLLIPTLRDDDLPDAGWYIRYSNSAEEFPFRTNNYLDLVMDSGLTSEDRPYLIIRPTNDLLDEAMNR